MKANKKTIKSEGTRKLLYDFEIREIEVLKNMPVKIWLPWKGQVTWVVTCYIILLADDFQKKSLRLVAFALILQMLLTFI